MKILEAYYNLNLRGGMKRYLLAEGKKISEIDRLYNQFGVYLSRIKGIQYHAELMKCSTETEFREKLNHLFDNLWKGHFEYKEMPKYFIRYLQYLHSASALDASLNIEGLENPEDIWCVPESDFTDYAKPYLKDGKLTIIANPYLIKKLLPYKEGWPLDADEAVKTARQFYHSLLPQMTDEDWRLRIGELFGTKGRRRAKANARNVQFIPRFLKQGDDRLGSHGICRQRYRSQKSDDSQCKSQGGKISGEDDESPLSVKLPSHRGRIMAQH